jgi:GntR family galactonate operon transcriptional repressor
MIIERHLRSARRGLHRDVVEALGRPIVVGDRPPGDALPNEADLSLELEVSRTVVREAIKVLAAMGLVEVRPKTGTRVLPRSYWRLIDPDVLRWLFEREVDERPYREISEVRMIIEPQAASLAAVRRTDAEAREISGLLDRMALATKDPSTYIAADIAFHSSILRATHNDLLTQMTATIHAALEASRTVTVRVPGGPAKAMPHHRAVSDAIVSRRGAAASLSMRRLVGATWKDVESILQGNLGDSSRADLVQRPRPAFGEPMAKPNARKGAQPPRDAGEGRVATMNESEK